MVKITMTPDEFFPEYNKVCFVKKMAELAGMKYYVMMQRIRHDVSRQSVARFSAKHMPALNAALATIADKVASLHLYFDPNAAERGKKAGIHVVPQFRDIGEWVHIKSITMETLGWNSMRYNNIVVCSTGKIYGHITVEDCDRINIALKKIAAFLGSVELVVEDEKKPTSVANKMVLLDSELDLLEEQLLLDSDPDME